MKNYILHGLFLMLISIVSGQQDPIPVQQLDAVLLQVNRIPTKFQRTTIATSVFTASQESLTRRQLSLQEYVQQIPGVFTQNANNFAQDLRVSIRGFGARSAFGIRGVKLIVDGIPETTPDGQGQLDNINLGIIDRIEVLKGPSSSLYGNASGGVLNINTRSFNINEGNFSNWKAALGSFGFQNYQVTAGIGDEKANYVFHANYGSSNGYRDQSNFEQINTNFKGSFKVAKVVRLTAILNYSDSPVAQDAGGLTLEEVQNDRRQARQRNIDFGTEESVQQLKAGVNVLWTKSTNTSVDAYTFYSNRKFIGKLPFEFGGVVDLNRNYLGQGASLTYRKNENTLKVGYDFGYQNDERKRFVNQLGTQGDQTLFQDENFTNLGLYVLDHYKTGNWYFTGGLRFDYNKIAVKDRFLSDSDASGERTLNAVNPSIGFSYRLKGASSISPTSVFANFATSFETPALSELSANPAGDQGFNEDLEAQKAISGELGIRGASKMLTYQIVVFYIRTRDELVPFELAEFPDRDFFRNASQTMRRGLEIEGSYAISKAFATTFAYTFSNFQYVNLAIQNSDVVGDFTLPGIPEHNTSIGVRFTPERGIHASLVANMVGGQFADDENLTKVAGYELINLRIAYPTTFRNVEVQPYLGINNILNQEYTDNVRINAFGRRYYEPAPKLAIFCGINLKL